MYADEIEAVDERRLSRNVWLFAMGAGTIDKALEITEQTSYAVDAGTIDKALKIAEREVVHWPTQSGEGN